MKMRKHDKFLVASTRARQPSVWSFLLLLIFFMTMGALQLSARLGMSQRTIWAVACLLAAFVLFWSVGGDVARLLSVGMRLRVTGILFKVFVGSFLGFISAAYFSASVWGRVGVAGVVFFLISLWGWVGYGHARARLGK